jgi:hypothetical protein
MISTAASQKLIPMPTALIIPWRFKSAKPDMQYLLLAEYGFPHHALTQYQFDQHLIASNYLRANA